MRVRNMLEIGTYIYTPNIMVVNKFDDCQQINNVQFIKLLLTTDSNQLNRIFTT